MATKVSIFFRECLAELKKVVWPSREDVVSSVKIVIVSTLILAVLLGLLDAGFTAAFRAVMK
jgi:preprotein translocase subunit SecE